MFTLALRFSALAASLAHQPEQVRLSKLKETIMTTQTQPTTGQPKTRPTHRISFSRIIGKDETGKDILGPAREIGAIWPRKNGKKGGVVKFDHIPAELALHQGVLFTVPVE